jgi:hypothetical protein
MRLSVPAARSGELVINSVLTTAASVRGNMAFIVFLLVVGCMLVFNTGKKLGDAAVLRYGV